MLGLPESTATFLRRPFSVFDFDAGRERLKIYYSASGSGTRILSSLRRGQEIGILGPLGRPFPESTRPFHVMVGGGRGGAPLFFLSRRRYRNRRVFLLVGARCEDELIPLGGAKASKVFVSTEDGSSGKKGTALDLLSSVVVSPGFEWKRAVLFGCGPVGMLRGLHEFAAKEDVPCFLSLEAQMACGLGVCQGCAVGIRGGGYSLVCTEGPVFCSSSVDWARYSEVKTKDTFENDNYK